MSEATTHEIEFAPGRTIHLETGRLAKQASGAVVARLGDTMVLCSAVVMDSAREGQGFFPLTVDYREKFSSAGKIPGGFIKREGRPSDKEVLTCRLIDRAVRPLFPDGYLNEVQIICYVISADDENDADVVASVGASAALTLTSAPFDGPIAEVRVGRIDGEIVINPTIEQVGESDVNLIVAGKLDSIVMVEGEMDEISEEEMLECIDAGHEAVKKLCQGQLDLADKFGRKETAEYSVRVAPDELIKTVHGQFASKIDAHIRKPYEKGTFYGGIDDLKKEVVEQLIGENETTEDGFSASEVKDAFRAVEKEVMREMIMADGLRIDGRSLDQVRNIWCDTSYLPRVHGSSVFTRGETQVLASITLGTSKDVQPVDQVFDTKDRRFYLHYNFPPFCTGEAKFLRGTSRREVGHGYLAERALAGQLPSLEEFPYTIRINSDVLESNGSSSMASVCSGSMALMDAGVPVKKPVAGIAMGMISDGTRTAILSDILGTEDHLGDMDFKVTGTRDGITACQMDIKIAGLSRELMLKAMQQAKEGRLHILDIMGDTISEPRGTLSPHAPRLTQISIDPSFIGAVIGPGGKIIQGIQRDTNTVVEIAERDGLGFVTIAATNGDDAAAALAIIKGIVTVPEAGEAYEGTVRNIQPFGAIVEIMPGKEGLLHISELDYGYVDNVEDYLQIGDKVKVQLLEVRDDGKLRLSRKPFLEKPEGYVEPERKPRSSGGGRGGERRGGGGGGGGRGGERRGNNRN